MTSNAAEGNRIVGALRIADGQGAVRMEDRFDTDIDDLWSALTDPGRLARWLGEFEGDLRINRDEFVEESAQRLRRWSGSVDECDLGFGALQKRVSNRPSLGMVAVQKALRCPALHLSSQLPTKVHGVLDTYVEANPTGREMNVGRIAG